MHRRVAMLGCVLALCVGVFAALAPTGGAARAHAANTAPLGGVNVAPISPEPLVLADRTIAAVHALHVAVIRTEVPWSLLEPVQGQIEPRAEAYADRLVSDAAAAGIRVIMTVDSTPCWDSSAPAAVMRKCTDGTPGPANTWPPVNYGDYGSFMAKLASRYGTELEALEVWNEPDQLNEKYLAGTEKAVHYAALLRAAYPAIKQANSQIPVLGGSIVGSNGIFLRNLYAAGIKGYYDGLAVHYYTVTLADLRNIRAVQLANGDNTPLWLMEFGWSSCLPQKIQEEQGCVNSKLQAKNLREMIHELAGTSYVAANVVYKLQDGPGEEFGLVKSNGVHKPAFSSLSSAFAHPFGYVPRVTIRLRRSAHHLDVSGVGPVGDYLKLYVYKDGLFRYFSEFSLNRFNEYSLQLPAVLGTRGVKVKIYQDWAGPHSAVSKVG